jgi:acetamidase/formamidase
MSATATTSPEAKLLQATPKTVHWGYLDAKIPPALTIDPGERVAIECLSCTPEYMPPKDRGFDILPDLVEVHQKLPKGPSNHILTGPVYVRGAQVGDVLAVKILDVKLRQNWGWNVIRPYIGTIPEDFPHVHLSHIPLDREAMVAVMPSGVKIPLSPFFGQLAVAPPPASGRQNAKEPREFGGNLDCKELTAGSTIYLPVWTEGALFSTGDGHAVQGDGEVNGQAIETCLAGLFEFSVLKGRGWQMPRAETATHYITFGVDVDLDDAARQCLKEMIAWIVAMTGMPKDEAYCLCSFACDLHVTQTVNNVKGVHAMLPKRILVK